MRMAGARKKPQPNGKFRGWYKDWQGETQSFTGTKRHAETKKIADRLEDEHTQIRLGHRPAPSKAVENRTRAFAEIRDRYLAWGERQGGRQNGPWGVWHLHHRTRHLKSWGDRLDLGVMSDLEDILERVEEEVHDLLDECAGKTVANYVEALCAFCDWCVKRQYLGKDPLKELTRLDTTPLRRRRSLTADEMKRLLSACAEHRLLMLWTAAVTGFRVKELRSLRHHHLDAEKSGLNLEAGLAKSRKAAFQPLPRLLTERLTAYIESGEASRIHDVNYARKDAKNKPPSDALLYVPSSPSNDLETDLIEAGILKETEEGVVDFHAVRVAFTNLIRQVGGADAKEAQELARHSSVDLTFNTYGRVEDSRLHKVIETTAAAITPDRALYVHSEIPSANKKNATTLSTGSCVSQGMVEPRGIEPLTS
jgi:integrase